MGRIYAISYGDSKYTMSLKVNMISAKLIGGADKTIAFSPKDISEDFKRDHQDILKTPRGGGLWLWKPYLIKETMERRLQDGDFLMYADSGTVYVNKIKCLTEVMERDGEDVFLSSSCFVERQWSKRDAFEIIGVDFEKEGSSFQSEATFILFKKSPKSMKFVTDWLNYCCDKRVISDDENKCGKENAADFIDNRHDQTALSLLGKKYEIMPYRGISDSSELYKVLQYDENAFGIPKRIRIENAIRHRKTEIYTRGTYPRIMVNTRLQNSNLYVFCRHIAKKVFYAKKLDRMKEKIEAGYFESEQTKYSKTE